MWVPGHVIYSYCLCLHSVLLATELKSNLYTVSRIRSVLQNAGPEIALLGFSSRTASRAFVSLLWIESGSVLFWNQMCMSANADFTPTLQVWEKQTVFCVIVKMPLFCNRARKHQKSHLTLCSHWFQMTLFQYVHFKTVFFYLLRTQTIYGVFFLDMVPYILGYIASCITAWI